ncbi:MAG: DoxX family protein [Gemmatimonadales bacterium]
MLKLPAHPAKKLALLALALFYIAAGVNHFVHQDFYVRIMPPYLPAHLALVYLSGVFEALGGIGVLIPRVRSLAGWGIVLLLIAVFPANLYMAMHPELFPDISTASLYLRLPIQIPLIAWAYWATRPDTTVSNRTSTATEVPPL